MLNMEGYYLLLVVNENCFACKYYISRFLEKTLETMKKNKINFKVLSVKKDYVLPNCIY